MGTFLYNFPKVRYDINRDKFSNFETITNITFRIGVVKEALTNFSSYFEYVIQDGDTPENLADKIYKNSQAHWIILYANDIYDPQYDWPLTYDAFNKYLENKYGSIANAQTTYHHYEKLIEREETKTQTFSLRRIQVNKSNVASTWATTAPYDYYDELPEEGAWQDYNINGKTIRERIYRNAVSNYDYELELNDSKRFIKIIKAEYYPQIIREFNTLTGTIESPFIRKLV